MGDPMGVIATLMTQGSMPYLGIIKNGKMRQEILKTTQLVYTNVL